MYSTLNSIFFIRQEELLEAHLTIMKEQWEINWKDYYEILQVHPSAEPEVIEAAFKKLAFKYFPDLNKDKVANKRMKDINEAHEIISNPEKRRRYHEAYVQRIGRPGNNSSTPPPLRPKPEVQPKIIRFQDLVNGEIRRETFIIKNTGGHCSKVWLSNPSAWIRIIRQTNLSETEKLPLIVEIEVKGEGWGKSYVDNIIIKLDDVETHVRVEVETKPQLNWGSHWDEAIRLHRVNEFQAALREYDESQALMPSDGSMIAFRVGANINKGEIYLMLFDGWHAQMCSQQSHEIWEQSKEREKQGVASNTMVNQSLLIGVASLIYIPDNNGKYRYGETKQLLENLLEKTNMPEVHYFMGVVNDKLSAFFGAKRPAYRSKVGHRHGAK
jgi:hypothetical protein